MNKKLIPAIIILLLLAGGAYYYMKMKPAGVADNQTAGQAQGEAAEFGKAMQSGKPTTCTMTKGSDVMEYMIKDKKMRVNTTTKIAEKTTVAHMINDTTYLYMWSDGQAQGTKMSAVIPSASPYASMAPVKSESTPKFDSEADYQGYKDQGYTINCKSGSVDDASFVPPSDVKFIDPTEMMKQVTAPGAAGQIDYKKLQEQYSGMQQPGADGVEY